MYVLRQVGMVRHFIRQGKINEKSLHTQSGLYSEEVTALSQYMEMLGPPTTFTPDEETLKRIRRMHVITMNILMEKGSLMV